jgi:Subtilase family/Peptidase inhibitor I9
MGRTHTLSAVARKRSDAYIFRPIAIGRLNTQLAGTEGGMRDARLAMATGLLFAATTAMLTIAPGVGAQLADGSGPSQAPLTPAQVQALSTNVSDKVIVTFKNQESSTPDTTAAESQRSAAIAAAQAPTVAELHQTHADKVHSYTLVNALSATVSPGEANRLAANPAVAAVIPDALVRGPDVTEPAPARGTAALPAPDTTNPIPPGACPAPGQPAYLGDELELTHTDSNTASEPTARSLGFTGAGVTVAFMAEGIDTDNPDFIRPDGSHVFVDYQDFSGDGLDAPTSGGEAFLDASAIASQGKTYNISHFGAVPLAGPCRIRVEGVAPGASLVGLKVFAQNGYSTTSGLLQAIDYAVNIDHVNVLNESLGYNPFPTIESQDILEEFNDAAVAAGTTVTVAAGDAGPADTIGSPDTDPHVINVGASDNFRFYAETGADGYVPPLATGGWISDNISGLSSGGVEESGPTDDLVAPGDTSFAACTPDVAVYADCTNLAYQPSSVEFSGGTSESSPLTAGAAALVIQAYRKTHGGATPTPAVIKQILVSTADDLGHPASEQGSGLLDTYRAVLAAESIAGPSRTAPAQGSQVLLSTGQLQVTGAPGSSASWPVTITNDGAGTSNLNLSTRTLGPALDTQFRRVTLTDAGPRFFNNFYDAPENYQTTTFNVAPGRDRLKADITYAGNQANPFLGNVDIVLIDPEGNFAADAVPQGVGNAAEVEVRYPAAGKWTAIISSAITKDQGTLGPVMFEAQTFDFQPLGTVSPSQLSIAPGKSATVRVDMTTPPAPGDQTAAVVVDGAFGQASSVAVSLRSLVQLSSGGHFSGLLTGGNGRQPDLGQVAYYQFDVPAHASGSTLLADVQLAGQQTDPVLAYLVDPSGQTLSTATNAVVTAFSPGPAETPTSAVEVAATAPPPGRWTLILNFAPTVTGNKLAEPYYGSVRLVQAPASGGLPASASTTLAAGQPVTVPITVHNTSTSPQDYFVDARLDSSTTLQLAPQSSPNLTLPMAATAWSPSWLVPPDTSEITLSGEATVPLTFDWGPGAGDPDLGATSSGDTAMGTWSGAPVTPGVWLADPDELGPYGAGPPPTASSSLAATVQTQPFDGTVSAPTGDLWLQSIHRNAAVQVFTIQPGQSAVIPVTITPSGSTGQVVSGTLYVDELAELASSATNAENYQPKQAFFQTGSQVAALPYEYQIG